VLFEIGDLRCWIFHNTNKQRTTAKHQSVCGCTYGLGREHGAAHLAGPPHVHVSVCTVCTYATVGAIVLQMMPPPQQPESVDTECSKMSASLMSFSGRIHFLLHRALAVWGRTPGSVGDRDVEQLSSQAARDRHRTGGSDHHRQAPLPGLPSCWTYCRYSCLPSKSTVDGHIRTETQPTIHPALRGGICLCNITSPKPCRGFRKSIKQMSQVGTVTRDKGNAGIHQSPSATRALSGDRPPKRRQGLDFQSLGFVVGNSRSVSQHLVVSPKFV
jgi:hypothetical protein